MPDDFYVECFLRGSTGDVKLAELACERTAAAYGALVDNIDKMYRAEDGNRIQLRLRKASPADVAAVSDLLQAKGNPPLQVAWADAEVTLASGTQKTQFNSEDCAPAEWVEVIESARIGNARWRDASWGNNAAPSWELFDGNRVLAEAFHYTVDNAERFTEHYEGQPYIQVLLLDDAGDTTRGFEASASALLNIISEPVEGHSAPGDALNTAAWRAVRNGTAFWTLPT